MASKKSQSFPAEVRRVEADFHETGQTPGTRTDVSYELGAEIDGVWVGFGSVAEGRYEVFKRASESRAEAEADDGGAESGPSSPTG
jgi:hypothetical protein